MTDKIQCAHTASNGRPNHGSKQPGRPKAAAKAVTAQNTALGARKAETTHAKGRLYKKPPPPQKDMALSRNCGQKGRRLKQPRRPKAAAKAVTAQNMPARPPLQTAGESAKRHAARQKPR
ncbi:MAG: hypothetical protein CSA76_03540, partial [Spirochaetales bacterium]